MLKLDINLLWTVVNVLIMYALLRKFLFKPVQDVLDKRQKMVDDEPVSYTHLTLPTKLEV